MFSSNSFVVLALTVWYVNHSVSFCIWWDRRHFFLWEDIFLQLIVFFIFFSLFLVSPYLFILVMLRLNFQFKSSRTSTLFWFSSLLFFSVFLENVFNFPIICPACLSCHFISVIFARLLLKKTRYCVFDPELTNFSTYICK